MKGTIDITIKRKNGTVEKRQEHNVVFDLPAIANKEYLKNPALLIFSDVLESSLLSNFSSHMVLSEEESDLTKPSWRPIALNTVSSGSATTYTSVSTIVKAGKKKSVTATWTMPSDEGFSLTLKSIQFALNRLPKQLWTQSAYQTIYYYGFCDGVYGTRYKKLNVNTFSFENTYYGGLAADANMSDSETVVIPYRMNLLKNVNGIQQRTTDGGFNFIDSNDKYTNYYYPYNSNYKLAIVDTTTNQIVLKFPLTQFTNFQTSSSDKINSAWVINTGTKNWLFQYDSSINASRIWQIPDTQTSDAIAPTSETFLQGISIYSPNSSSDYASKRLGVIGNYIIVNNKVYKVADDLTVTAFKGYSDGSQSSNGYSRSSEYYWKYMNKDYLAFETTALPRSDSSLSQHTLVLAVSNETASNFSTPITLAAGDVLTVSYTISVGA